MKHLDGIAMFVRAVEAGSFVAAARELGLTASAVGKAVGRLEDALGLQLLRRSTRSLETTEDGRALYERCRGPLGEIASAESFLMDRREKPRGRLKVSSSVAFAAFVLSPMLPDFAAANPEVEIEIVATDRFADLVDEGIDVAIRTGMLEDFALIARKLIDTRFMTCAAPSYLTRRGRPERLTDLAEHECLGFVLPRSGRVFAWPFQSDATPVFHEPNARLRFDHADSMIAAAIAGGGLVHLQDYMLRRFVEDGRLVEVLESHAADGGPVSAVYLPNRHLSPKVRAFAAFLASRLGG
jgi:DNA-binding transcriptional LysR family regulator